MEGEGAKPLPSEDKLKGTKNKTLVIVVAVIVVLAAVLGVFLVVGGGNKGPTAKISVSSNFVSLGIPVVFNGSASSDPDGSIAKYNWWFGDSTSSQQTTTASVSHTYANPGNFIAVLQVEDDKGATADTWSSLVKIEVTNPEAPSAPTNNTKPIALIAGSADVVKTGDKVNITAGDSKAYGWDGSAIVAASDYITKLTWNFGDGSAPVNGSFADKALVNHTFTGAVRSMFPVFCIVQGQGTVQEKYFSTVVIQPVSGGVKNRDTFVVANIADPDPLDPAYDYETGGGEILDNVYERLVWYDGASAVNLKGLLATSVPTIANGGISADGLNYTYHLRPNVKFHNGEIMTATDVEYSLERTIMMNSPDGPGCLLGALMIPDYWNWSNTDINPSGVPPQDLINASVEIIDSSTVVVHLIQPYPAFNQAMAHSVASIISKTFVEAHGGVVRGQAYNPYLANHECGTGPFTLKEWKVGQYVLMERFANYHQTPAALKYVIIKRVDDVATREMMLFSGDADSIYVPRQYTNDVRNKNYLRIDEGHGQMAVDFVGFNHDIKPSTVIDVGTITPWFFDDVQVRMGFVHAFDYAKANHDIMLDTAITPNGVVPQGMMGYNASLLPYDFNLQTAADYLNAAIDNTSGMSWGTKGFTVNIYYNTGNLVRESAALLLKDGLEKLTLQGKVAGEIHVGVYNLDWSAGLLTAVRHGEVPIFFLGWLMDYPDPDNFCTPFYLEGGTYALRMSLNDHILTGMVIDAAFELDPTVREQKYFDIGNYVKEQAYFLWTFQATNFHVERTWVNGYYFNPAYSGAATGGYYYVLSKG
jgi:peptide/nickel transport system substrate-binding protein